MATTTITPDQFWLEYLATLPPDHPAQRLPVPPAESYGDSPELADELVDLIYRGLKTATCAALWYYEAEQAPLPKVDQYEIALDGRGVPVVITKTIEVTIKPFDEVDSAFAFDEGEGDRSYDYWREGHWRYFSRVLPLIGKSPDPKMLLVCQRFQVVFRR